MDGSVACWSEVVHEGQVGAGEEEGCRGSIYAGSPSQSNLRPCASHSPALPIPSVRRAGIDEAGWEVERSLPTLAGPFASSSPTFQDG